MKLVKKLIKKIFFFVYKFFHIRIHSDSIIVHTKSCSSATEKAALLFFADHIFESYDLDINYLFHRVGKINLAYGSSKQNFTSWHISRFKVYNHKKSLVLEQPIYNRGLVTENYSSSSFRVGINGFLKNNCIQFAKIFKNDSFFTHNNNQLFKIVKPWKKFNFREALIVGQVPNDASLSGRNIYLWIDEVIDCITPFFDKITIRTPQIQYKEYFKKFPNINIEKGTYENKIKSLNRVSAVFTFSSTFAVDAAIYGVPVFADDIGNFLYDLAPNHYQISKSFEYKYFDRKKVVNDLKKYQLSYTNLTDKRLSKYISKKLNEFFF